jgi:hypothetical protein
MILRKTAMFIRDLLAYDEQLIRVGRQGYDIDDFTIGYIAVDTLGPAQRLGGGEVFDPVAEVMKYQEQWRAPVTISFYGNGAWQRATDFSLLLRSQKAYELQDLLGIGVYLTSGLTDVKMLTGQQYGERQELTVNVQYSTGINVGTLRIDTEQIELTT